MPNWGYLVVHGVWLTSLAIWLGGSVFVTFVAAPTAFGTLPTREDAGQLVGEMLRRSRRWVFACLVALAVTGGIKFAIWENPVVPVFLRYGTLAVGALAALVALLVIDPRLHALRGDPERRPEFRRLHGVSMVLMLVQMLAVGAVLFLS